MSGPVLQTNLTAHSGRSKDHPASVLKPRHSAYDIGGTF
jgi:hypothetical protein